MSRVLTILGFAAFVGFVCMHVYASTLLTHITDLISTSAPSTEATHTITFEATDDIPPSGQIVITFQPGVFTIPPALDYQDIDFAESTTSGETYVDRDILGTPDATDDGVQVTTGTSGSITITLNSTQGISAGEYIEVRIGTNATYGATGINMITNPDVVHSYSIPIVTYDALGNQIDYGGTMIAVVAPVGLTGRVPVIAPFRFNGLPMGTLAANSQNIELSLQTDITASCRYATTTGVLYQNMTGLFGPSNATFFTAVEHNFQNGNTYDFYVRCRAFTGGTNDDDYDINFTIKPAPSSNTSVEAQGNESQTAQGDLGPGGVGGVPNGAETLYLSSVTLSGWSIPGSAITLYQDGVKAGTTQAKADGSFKATISNIERGSYDFGVSAQDPLGLSTALYSTSLSVEQGTQNDITSIVTAPTLQLSSNVIQPGDALIASGYASPNSRIQLTLTAQGSKTVSVPLTYTASSSADGSWHIPVDTSSYAKGTYAAEALASRFDGSKSGISKLVPLSVGVGNPSKGTCGNRSDLNCDGKVNLIDFSILLTFWNTNDANADINQDGTVNLGDFSIMLFNWTG